MLTLDGLLGCAVVDGNTGLVIAREAREEQPVDIELAAAACAQVLRAHRQAARNMGLSEHIEEIITTRRRAAPADARPCRATPSSSWSRCSTSTARTSHWRASS